MDKVRICPKLWKNLFINAHGEVYACCESKPHVLGNIMEETLAEIWEGRPLNRLRAGSAHEELSCIEGCGLIEDGGWLGRPGIHQPRIVPRLHIEFHEFCNVRCIFCYQLNLEKRGRLDPDKLLKHLEGVQVGEIMLQGGETLAIPSCVRFFEDVTEKRKIPVILLTNGLFFNEHLTPKIAKSCPKVIVSINAATKQTHERINVGSSFEKVVEGVARLKGERETQGTACRLEAHMTLVPENVHETVAFLGFAHRQGFDTVGFCTLETTLPFLDSHPGIRLGLLKDLNALEKDAFDLLREDSFSRFLIERVTGTSMEEAVSV